MRNFIKSWLNTKDATKYSTIAGGVLLIITGAINLAHFISIISVTGGTDSSEYPSYQPSITFSSWLMALLSTLLIVGGVLVIRGLPKWKVSIVAFLGAIFCVTYFTGNKRLDLLGFGSIGMVFIFIAICFLMTIQRNTTTKEHD